MAETGGPALSEIQVQPAGVVDRVKGKLREMFTPTGRAEVMAQRQIDTILEQVAPQDRIKAMEHLEKLRPEFVADKMEDAKGSLVRDAAIGVAAVGGLAGAVIWRKEIGGLAGKGVKKVYDKMPQKVQGAVLQGASKVTEARGTVDKFSGGLKGKVEGAMSWIRAKFFPSVRTPIPPVG